MPDLSHLEDDFNSAEEAKANNLDEVPDGKYHIEVIDAVVKNAKSSGAPMLAWTLKIISGRFVGRMLWRNNMLESKQNLGWLKKDLKVCGIVLEKINDLNQRADELIGLRLEVTKKTSEKFSNVYLNKLLTRALGESVPEPQSNGNGHAQEQASGTPVDDSEIPF